MMKLHSLHVLSITFTLLGCAKGVPPEEQTASEPETPTLGESVSLEEGVEPAEETKEVEVTLTHANWEEIKAEVAKHKGKVVVLDLWSTSCPPCLREFPNLVALSKKYPEKVVCLSCSTDYIGIKSKPPEYYEEKVKGFLTEQKAAFTNFLCTIPGDELYAEIDLASIPAVYVYDPQGNVSQRFDNDEGKFGDEFTYEDHVIPLIDKLLGSEPTE